MYTTLELTELQRKDYKIVMTEIEFFMTLKKNEVYKQFLFDNWKQEEDELFNHFVTDLKKLDKTCEFGDTVDSMT